MAVGVANKDIMRDDGSVVNSVGNDLQLQGSPFRFEM